MINIYLEWDPNPCALVPNNFSLFWRREHIGRDGVNHTNYTATEIVLGGELLEYDLKEPWYIHLAVGKGNSYAVVAHNGEKSSQPAIVASNVDAYLQVTENSDGETIWATDEDGVLVPYPVEHGF